MREFILRARKARTDFFDIEDLVEAGRMDLVTRCVSNALFISNNMRKDTIIHVVLEGPSSPPKTISFIGKGIKNFAFDEKGVAKFILMALKKGKNLKANEEIVVSDGIIISKKSFESLVKDKKDDGKQLIYLHPKGKSISDIKIEEDVVFVFGDYIGMPRKTERFLDNLGAIKVNISPFMLFSSHCIIIVHNELDKSQAKYIK